MPLYEYKCQKCKMGFEALRRMDEMDQKIECPHCGSDETKRQLSVFGVGGGGQRSSNSASIKAPPSCGG